MPQQDPITEFIALPQDRQMEMLKKLPRENQDRLLAQVKARRGAKAAAAPGGPEFSAAPTAAQKWKNLFTHPLNELEAESRTHPRLPDASMGEMARTDLANAGAGVAGVIRHPVDTAVGMLKAGARASGAGLAYDLATGKPTVYREMFDQFNTKGPEAGAQMVGQGVALEALTPAAIGAYEGVKSKLPAPRAPRVLSDLVKDTRAENVAGAEKSAGERAKYIDAAKQVEEHNRAESTRHQGEVDAAARTNLKAHMKHVGDKANVEQGNAAAKAIPEARTTLQRDIDAKSDQLDVRVEKARHDALVEGNKKYSAVNEKLSHLPGDVGKLAESVGGAETRIQGTQVKLPILESIKKGVENAHINYGDLQGWFSELGRELSKGTLPGDVYMAYNDMHEAVGDQMQTIADSQGAGAELTAARAYWRRMKQTFGKSSDSIGDRAAKTVQDESPDLIDQQQREYRLRLLGSFDPTIPDLANQVASARSQLKALPKEGATAEVPQYPEAVEVGSPKFKPAPKAPAPFKPKTIGAEDVAEAKAGRLEKRADWVRTRGQWAATWPVFYVLRDAFRGQGFPVGEAAMEAGGTLALTHSIARVLESPRVVKFLTKATAADMEAIPPDLRGSFPGIVRAAQARKIPVSPALMAAFGSKGPAPKAGNPTDEWAGTHSQR